MEIKLNIDFLKINSDIRSLPHFLRTTFIGAELQSCLAGFKDVGWIF